MDEDIMHERFDALTKRVAHLEKVMYTTNGTPGLIERVRVISRLLWIVLAVTSANLFASGGAKELFKALSTWFGG